VNPALHSSGQDAKAPLAITGKDTFVTTSDSQNGTGTVALDLSANTPEKAEAQRRAQAALDEFFAGKPDGPVPRSVWLGDGYVEAYLFNRRLHLAAVFVMPENRLTGLGGKYLHSVLEAADKHGSEVECSVEAFGDNSDKSRLTNRQLMAWYKRHGFVPVPNRKNFLVRPAATLVAQP
jgi:GNAT superfamily N-acetyltransferase